MITAEIDASNKPNKRFKVVVKDDDKKKTIHFGLKNPKGKGTYLEHKDDKIKDAWEARHKVRENWNDPYTAGFWSKWVLWNKPKLEDSLDDIEKRFKIIIT